MTRFKFRVWDDHQKEWITDCDLYMTATGEVYFGDVNNPPIVHVKQEWVSFSTGIRDINGRGIYEGDILKVWKNDDYIPNRDSGGGIVDYDIQEGFSQLGVVSFKNAWFVYETKKHLAGQEKTIFAPLDFHANCKVIGNKYEHPHLLESEDDL